MIGGNDLRRDRARLTGTRKKAIAKLHRVQTERSVPALLPSKPRTGGLTDSAFLDAALWSWLPTSENNNNDKL